MPSVQIPRLRRLYLDLHEALTPLFPPNHRILFTLDAPPPPSSSPLLSTVNLLKEILVGLRERCAPVRDEQIDALLSSLIFPPAASQHSSSAVSLGNSPPKASDFLISPLAQFVVDKIKDVLSLAEDMKSDLNNFVLGSMTEEQVMQVLSAEVKSREREFVVNLWGSDQIHMLWQSWVTQTSRRDEQLVGSQRWINRLRKALEADKPVFCVPPESLSSVSSDSNGGTKPNDPTTNNLPPQLFFITPTLIYLQNYLQAIVIAASLRLLARPPPSILKTVDVRSHEPDSDFVQRVWTLLKAEIDDDSMINPSFDGTFTTVPETKLINLADEVVRVRQSYLPAGVQSLPSDEEKRVRDSVDRTLRTNDPVFLLLKRRLLDALEDKLFPAFRTEVGGGHSSSHFPLSQATLAKSTIPERMQTGRDLGSVRSVKTNIQSKTTTQNGAPSTSHIRIEVLGFEHDVLRSAMLEVYEKLVGCIAWTERVWGDDLRVTTEVEGR